MNTFLSLLTGLLPLLGSSIEPAILNEWNGSIYPALQADVAGISNVIEKAAATVALDALNAAAQVAIKDL